MSHQEDENTWTHVEGYKLKYANEIESTYVLASDNG